MALQNSSPMMPPKSAKSSRAIEMIAATSMAQDSGFHMYPKNLSKGLTVDSGNLLGPYCSSLLVCSAVVSPFSLHCTSFQAGSVVLSFLHLRFCTPLFCLPATKLGERCKLLHTQLKNADIWRWARSSCPYTASMLHAIQIFCLPISPLLLCATFNDVVQRPCKEQQAVIAAGGL